MRFSFTLLSGFLLASAVLANRRREDRRTRFLNRIEQPNSATSEDDEYNIGWAGVIFNGDKGAFTSVSGTFTVPIPSGHSGSAAAAWVGIDGDTCTGSGLLQAGVDLAVTDSGVAYGAWYEWFPDYSYSFPDLPISAGDVIRVNVTSYSPTSGFAIIENLTNGKSGRHEVNSTHAICGDMAEWIVEDFDDGNFHQVPFADFGVVTFRDAVATGNKSSTPRGVTIVNIKQNNKILTSVSTNGSTLTIKYV